MEARDSLQDVGRGIAQLHLRLGKLSEAVEQLAAPRGGTTLGTADAGRARDALLDLVDAVDEALARRPTAARRGLLARLRPASAGEGEDLWRGLALAAARAHEALAALGVTAVPTAGPFDPGVQRAVEREDGASAPGAAGRDVVVRTHRRGWVQARGEAREVLRTALVTVRRT